MAIYITGDTHGDFRRIEEFCERMDTTKEDTMIVLGDAGINFNPGRNLVLKDYLSSLPITFFCIHGNHERRPESMPSYTETTWHGGKVYLEYDYPRLLFAKDGEVYDLDGKKAIAIGGAYSVDKYMRLENEYVTGIRSWWEDEQPSDEIKRRVEDKLDSLNWKVNFVLSHTVPLRYIPTETFLSCVDQSKVDRSTEEWLGEIEEKLSYEKWYAGHYHTDKRIDKLEILFTGYDSI